MNSGEISGNVNGQSCLTTMMTMNRFGKRRLTGNGSRYDREFEQENGRKRGKNEVPDVDSWFKRKLGNMFNEDMNRDSQM